MLEQKTILSLYSESTIQNVTFALVKTDGLDVFDIPQRIGFIRSRLNLDEDEATREWKTKCFGAAYRIKKS